MIPQCESFSSASVSVLKLFSNNMWLVEQKEAVVGLIYRCAFVLPEQQYSDETKETLTRIGKAHKRYTDVWLIKVNSLFY